VDNFYCQKVVGDANFSISEWNNQYKLCNDLGIEFPKGDTTQCTTQCLNCRTIVAERRMRTQLLYDKKIITE
jgi:hypothetical protein